MQCGTGVHGCLGTAVPGASCPDDWAAIQSCINENPGAHIYFSKLRGPQSTSFAYTYPDYYMSQPLVPCGSDQRLDGGTGGQSGGTNLEFAVGSAGIRIVPNTTSPNANPCPYTTASADGVHIEHITLYGGGGTGMPISGADGIYVNGSFASIDNVLVKNFGQHGIHIDSSISGGADSFYVHHSLLLQNRGDGMYTHGGNSSVGVVIDTTSNNNGQWGFDEEGFLGNTYVQPHAEANGSGPYKAMNLTGRNVFVNPYSEGDTSQFGPSSLVLGGNVTPDYKQSPSAIQAYSATGIYSTRTVFNDYSVSTGEQDPISLGTNGFNGGEFAAFTARNSAAGNVARDSVTFKRTSDGVHVPPSTYGTVDNGWWGFRTNTASDEPYLENYPLLFSDSLTSVGHGWSWFPNGFFIGGKDSVGCCGHRRQVSIGSSVPVSAGSLGDLVLNANPVAGGTLGWVNVGASTWNAFGPIGETSTSGFSTSGTISAFLPGALNSTWTGTTWTPDKPIVVTQIQVQAKTAPSGCATNAVVAISDGTNQVSVSIAGHASTTSGASTAFAPSAPLTIGVTSAASGCATLPSDANVVVQYRMRQ